MRSPSARRRTTYQVSGSSSAAGCSTSGACVSATGSGVKTGSGATTGSAATTGSEEIARARGQAAGDGLNWFARHDGLRLEDRLRLDDRLGLDDRLRPEPESLAAHRRGLGDGRLRCEEGGDRLDRDGLDGQRLNGQRLEGYRLDGDRRRGLAGSAAVLGHDGRRCGRRLGDDGHGCVRLLDLAVERLATGDDELRLAVERAAHVLDHEVTEGSATATTGRPS